MKLKKIIIFALIIIFILPTVCYGVGNGYWHNSKDYKTGKEDEIDTWIRDKLKYNGYEEYEEFTYELPEDENKTTNKHLSYDEKMYVYTYVVGSNYKEPGNKTYTENGNDFRFMLYNVKNDGAIDQDSIIVSRSVNNAINTDNTAVETQINNFIQDIKKKGIPLPDDFSVSYFKTAEQQLCYKTSADIVIEKKGKNKYAASITFGDLEFTSVEEVNKGEEVSKNAEVKQPEQYKEGTELLTSPWAVDNGGPNGGSEIEDPTKNADAYTSNIGKIESNSKVKNIATTVISAIRTIGIALSVIMLTVLGIKYMFGSLEEKAQYKESFIPWIIGAILLVAGTSIVQFIYNMITK